MDTLRLGSRGPYVEALQLALTRAGYNPGTIDGIFGPRTQAAVIAFQRDRGLAADGIAGPLTNAALQPYLRGYLMHTIRPGDTFYALANRYGTTLYTVLTANPDVDILNLQPGQQVVIPLAFAVVPTGIRYTAQLTQDVLYGLRRRFPFIRLFTIGESVMGRPIWAASIGEGPTEVSYKRLAPRQRVADDTRAVEIS